MRIKRYLVNSMDEALQLIRREMGPEAVIVNSRKFRKPGLKGLFSAPLIEVTAAADVELHDRPAPAEGQLLTQMRELKAAVEKLNTQQAVEKLVQEPELQRWQEILWELEVSQEIITRVLTGLQEELQGVFNPQTASMGVKEQLLRCFPEGDRLEKRVQALIGPTGVGKTTTLAKLASRASLEEGRKVGLITIDTYRIGAVEQLKTYAQILGLPLEVVLSPPEMKDALARLADCQLIMVDTVGHASHNPLKLAELKAFLAGIDNLETFLVLSSTVKNKDLLKIANDYQRVGYDRLIFTKVDETNSLGSIVNVARATGKAVAYITNGQSVPDDLEKTDPGRLAELILEAVNR